MELESTRSPISPTDPQSVETVPTEVSDENTGAQYSGKSKSLSPKTFSSWPASFYASELNYYGTNGILPVVFHLTAGTRFAFAVRLQAPIYQKQPFTNSLHESSIYEVDNVHKLEPVNISDRRAVALYFRENHGQLYSLIQNPLVRLTPHLTFDSWENEIALAALPGTKAAPGKRLKLSRYLMIRARIFPKQKDNCIDLVVLLRTRALGPYPLLAQARYWRLDDWKKYWYSQEELSYIGSENEGDTAIRYYNSMPLLVCRKQRSRSHLRRLTQKDRKALRVLLVASRGRTYRTGWQKDKLFFAEWRLQRVVNITRPVFQFFYGFDKVRPLTAGTNFHIRVRVHDGEPRIFMTAKIPKRADNVGWKRSLPYDQGGSQPFEPEMLGFSDQIAFFVLLLVGEQTHSNLPVKVVGRSELIRFSIGGSRFGIRAVWIPCFVTILFFLALLLIIPFTRLCITRTIKRIWLAAYRVGKPAPETSVQKPLRSSLRQFPSREIDRALSTTNLRERRSFKPLDSTTQKEMDTITGSEYGFTARSENIRKTRKVSFID